MNIELLESQIKLFGDMQELLVMIDNVTKTKILFAEVAHYNNPRELEQAKIRIYRDSLKDVDKIRKMFEKVSGV